MAKSKLRQMKKQGDLQKRTQESFAKKDSSGKYGDYLKETTVPKWSAKDGDHIIDIIPFIVGENHPTLAPDTIAYNIDVFAHRNIGATEDMVICLARTIGKPCPICEYQNKLRKVTEDEDEIKKFSPTRRCLYNIVCLDSDKDEKMGIQLWEVSHYLSEANIMAIARDKRTGAWIPFADPDEGMSVAFTKSGKGISTKYAGYEFVERDYEISDEILDSAVTLDEILDFKEYDEIKEMLEELVPPIEEYTPPTSGEEDDGGDASPRTRRGRINEHENENENENEDDAPVTRRQRKPLQEKEVIETEPEMEEKHDGSDTTKRTRTAGAGERTRIRKPASDTNNSEDKKGEGETDKPVTRRRRMRK